MCTVEKLISRYYRRNADVSKPDVGREERVPRRSGDVSQMWAIRFVHLDRLVDELAGSVTLRKLTMAIHELQNKGMND
jgi:hypothetical protein